MSIGLILCSCASAAAPQAPAASAKPGASAAVSLSGAPAGSAGATLVKITVASAAVTPSASPAWIAKEGSIFEKNGLDVTLTAIAGASTTISALLAGDVQILNAGAGEAMSAIAAGTDLVFLGLLEPVYSYTLEVPASIKTPADLKGKTLGVVAVGATVDVATRVALRKLGLEADKEVKITALGTQSADLAAIINGTVDGGVLNLTDALQAEAKGLHPLLNMADAKLPAATSAIYTQRSYTASHHDVVQKYIDSMIEGAAREKADKPFSLGVFKKYLKLDDDKLVTESYDYFTQKVIPDLPFAKPENFADSVSVLSAKNPKIAEIDWSKYIDSSFVQSAADRHLDRPPNS